MKKFLKFGLVGVANTAIDFFVFSILVHFFGVSEYPSQVVGFLCGMVNSYLCNKFWTFQTAPAQTSTEIVRFAAANLLVLGLSLFFMSVALEFLKLSWLPAKILVTAATLGINFLLSRTWVFRAKKGGNTNGENIQPDDCGKSKGAP